MRRRTKTYIALGAIAAALAVLMISGFNSGASYYLELGEAKAKAASLQSKRIQIRGNVAAGSIVWQPESFALSFALTDGVSTLSVSYKGVRPDNFIDDAPVIAEGKLQTGGTFVADKLLMQCPSKYEAKPADAATSQGSLLEPAPGGTR